jgi:tRNA-dihydrouridine synthase
MQSIWQNLPHPFFVQAPMEGVSDTVFRQVLLETGTPDVFFTEFTNVDGLCSSGNPDAMRRLQHTAYEKPIIAQLWGNTPENYSPAVKIVKDLGFDGVDINMGCPDREIVKKGYCSGLINNRNLAREIILATKEAAGDLSVSVKTRIGYDKIITEDWIGFLLEHKLKALIVHGRTTREMSKVETHWDEIGRAVELRNRIAPKTIIIGNGDIESREEGIAKCEKYKCDGVMIGRGILHNLWIFNNNSITPETISHTTKIKMLIHHLELFEKTWGSNKDWNALKKFYKVYVADFPNASDLRMKLMEFKNAAETIKYLSGL